MNIVFNEHFQTSPFLRRMNTNVILVLQPMWHAKNATKTSLVLSPGGCFCLFSCFLDSGTNIGFWDHVSLRISLNTNTWK